MRSKRSPKSTPIASSLPPDVFSQESWKDRLRLMGTVTDSHTIPLWCRKSREDPSPEVRGSGVLLQVAHMFFLITAYHMALLTHSIRRRRDRMEFIPLPEVRYPYLSDPVDLAAIPLTYEFVDSLDPSHVFATLDSLDPTDRMVPQPSPYVVHGYLSEMSQPGAINYQTYAMHYFSSKYIGPESTISGFSHQTQLALKLQNDEVTRDIDGTRKPLPDLGGMSGCGIWRQGFPPSNSIHLVGITTRWNKDPRLVIGSQCELLLAFIATVYPELRSRIELRVGWKWKRPGWRPRFKISPE